MVARHRKDGSLSQSGHVCGHCGNSYWDLLPACPYCGSINKGCHPGGSDALSQLIGRNLIYPATAQENGIQGHVVIGCIVEADGTVSGYEVIRSVEPSLDREALRVAHLIRKLNPATENGKPVRAKYYIPFNFKL